MLLFTLLLLVEIPMAFITSSCNVDGGSERISVVVDKYLSLSDTAVGESRRTKKNMTNECCFVRNVIEIMLIYLPGRISTREQC